MNNRLTITFDPALSNIIAQRALQEKEPDVPNYVTRLLRIALSEDSPRPQATQSQRRAISQELQSFVGIAKTADKRDLKERKEEYLSKKYHV